MQLSLQNFTTLVQNFASSVQGACSSLVDFTTGSVLLAIGEASSSVALWMQWLILQTLSLTRAATSNGSDLDSWVNDFSLFRLPATYASGSVTFTRFTPTSQALILPGVQVKSADGTQIFNVVADTTQAAWSASLGGYVIASGIASANATVVAVNAGTQGNVQAGTITLLASAIPFVDTVTNASNFTNGVNAETDAALRARFTNYIQTRSEATLAAVTYALSTVQQGLSVTIYENVNSANVATMGDFVVVVDDGSGAPPSSLIAACAAAVWACRPVGSVPYVTGPSVTTATVAMTITTNPTTNKPALLAPVQAAVIAYINAIQDGITLPYSRLAGIAYAVDPSIIDVTGITLQSGTSDLSPASAFGAIKATSGSVTVN